MGEESLKWREFEYKVLFWTSWGTSLVTICIFVLCVLKLLFPEDVTPRLQEFVRQISELNGETNTVNVTMKALEGEVKRLSETRTELQEALKQHLTEPEPKLVAAADEGTYDDLGTRSVALIRELKTSLQQLADMNRKRFDQHASRPLATESRPLAAEAARTSSTILEEHDALVDKIRTQLRELKQKCIDKQSVAIAAAERWLAEQEQLASKSDWDMLKVASGSLSDQIMVDSVIVIDRAVLQILRPEKSLTVRDSLELVNKGLLQGQRLLKLAEFVRPAISAKLQADKYWSPYFKKQLDPVTTRADFLTIRELSTTIALLNLAEATDNTPRRLLARTLAEQWVAQALRSVRYELVPYSEEFQSPTTPTPNTGLPLPPETVSEADIEAMLELEPAEFFNALVANPPARRIVRQKMVDSLAACLEVMDFPDFQEAPLRQLDAESESNQHIVQMLMNRRRAAEDLNRLNEEIDIFVTTVYTNTFGESSSYPISAEELMPKAVIGQLLEQRNGTWPMRWSQGSSEAADPEAAMRTTILSFEQRVDQWREQITEIDEKFGLEQQRLRKLADEEQRVFVKRKEELENGLLTVRHDINMAESRLLVSTQRAAQLKTLLSEAEEQRRIELEMQRKYGTPAAWGSIIGAVGGAACQLVAGTVLLILTRVGTTLTQYRQAESEERRQSEKLKLLGDIKEPKLREHTIAAILTAQSVPPPTTDPAEIRQPAARKKRATKPKPKP